MIFTMAIQGLACGVVVSVADGLSFVVFDVSMMCDEVRALDTREEHFLKTCLFIGNGLFETYD